MGKHPKSEVATEGGEAKPASKDKPLKHDKEDKAVRKEKRKAEEEAQGGGEKKRKKRRGDGERKKKLGEQAQDPDAPPRKKQPRQVKQPKPQKEEPKKSDVKMSGAEYKALVEAAANVRVFFTTICYVYISTPPPLNPL